jgi:hypothetical protein
MKLQRTATFSLVALVLVFSASPAIGFDFFEITPGSTRDEVEDLLKDAGLRYRFPDPSRIEVRANVLSGVFELQRAIFEFGVDGRLDTATVEITPAMNSDGLEVLELYDEVASLLLRRLGRPTRECATGMIQSPGQILVGLGTGEVERLMEWETESFVRIGIPRRVDGKILVVVAVSNHAFPGNDLFWGPR